MLINDRIQQLLDERQWSEYKLAKASGLSQSTISNFFHRNTIPSISTLEAICDGFGITLSQFFATENMVELPPDQLRFFAEWSSLTSSEKDLIFQLIRALKHGSK